ncbi:Mg2+ transporter [Mycobacterium tuberculosis]|nr:Mg2+ transporter [Mycobacterium tuberculosis]
MASAGSPSLAAAAVVRAWTLGVGPQVTLTVALTVAAIVVWSSLVAAVLPPLLKKLRIDPAIVSGPMIATIVDGTGLLIYFLVAHLTLTELHGL